MASVGIRELKSRLTYYLRRTKQGEDIIVTERRTPIAILQRLDLARTTERDAKLARLTAEGIVIPPTRQASRPWKPVKLRGRPLSETVLEAREQVRDR
jgi:prevent-host-death family protein